MEELTTIRPEAKRFRVKLPSLNTPKINLVEVMTARPLDLNWTATGGFVVTQDFFTYCLAAKVDG